VPCPGAVNPCQACFLVSACEGLRRMMGRAHDGPAKNRSRPHPIPGPLPGCTAGPRMEGAIGRSLWKKGLVAPLLSGDRGSRRQRWGQAVRVCRECEMVWIPHSMWDIE